MIYVCQKCGHEIPGLLAITKGNTTLCVKCHVEELRRGMAHKDVETNKKDN